MGSFNLTLSKVVNSRGKLDLVKEVHCTLTTLGLKVLVFWDQRGGNAEQTCRKFLLF
jgi:hypothetical protein